VEEHGECARVHYSTFVDCKAALFPQLRENEADGDLTMATGHSTIDAMRKMLCSHGILGKKQCIECRREYKRRQMKAWSKAHPGYFDKYTVRRKATCRAFVRWLKDAPCIGCGEVKAPNEVDLHHRLGEQKLDKISTIAKQGNTQQLLAELQKCDVLCKPCHRTRHKHRVRVVVAEGDAV